MDRVLQDELLKRIIEKYEIRHPFSEEVLNTANELEFSYNDNRLDLRNELIVTIDGADSKDLDDAVSLRKEGEDYILGVHIADVSHYVIKDGIIDTEAFMRGTSFYFINKVIPMLPERLSNGLCSLNPNEDKLALSVFITINENGLIKDFKFFNTIIKSSYRLTYDNVSDFIMGKEQFTDPKLCLMLESMNDLMKKMNKIRFIQGGIDFNFPEIKCVLDENNKPIAFYKKDRLDSERLIEEFMLAANICAAKFISQSGSAVYRIHETPDKIKIQQFIKLMNKLEISKVKSAKDLTVFKMQEILEAANKSSTGGFISHLLLRSMQQAKYDQNNVGHFGLGFTHYTHFTSPIRRYPDLIVHRLIKHKLAGQKKNLYTESQMNSIAEISSKQERVSVDTEREYFKFKSAEFMVDKIGEEFDAIISGISSFGIFASINKYGVEGLISYRDMQDDYYIFDEENFTASGKKNKKVYRFGDLVKVKVIKANKEKGFVDLIIADGSINESMPKKFKGKFHSRKKNFVGRTKENNGKKRHSSFHKQKKKKD